ncbi:MAG: esterase/lipase [Osedax symbiont Rs2]|nr:MAG: esterase/lipase [Osedax symbiont Rs2]
MQVNKIFRPIGTVLVVLLLSACSSEQSWLKPTGSAAGVPKDQNLAFEQYVSDSRSNIEQVLQKLRFVNSQSPYVGDYNAQQVAQMRGPFQIPDSAENKCSEQELGAGKGFLLIHGLTDSPYLLKGMAQSLHQAYPCSLVRAVLLPGHGTVVGDSLQMKYQDWQAITDYGVHSFQRMQDIDELYVLGFSTGTALAIKHLQQGNTDKIKGLILLSTAVKAKSDLAWMAGYVNLFKDWIGVNKERDAARYSSFSSNAGAQFYQLTKDLMSPKYEVDIPVLMAVSADDATINPEAAREFFCKYTTNQRKHLIWYRGYADSPTDNCAGVYEVERGELQQNHAGKHYKYANTSHPGISVGPADSHYGVAGVYRDCKAYEADGEKQWQACMQDTDSSIFGEKNIADMSTVLAGGYWRRATFNRQYQQLIQSIVCFADQDCNLNSILR